MRKNRHLIALAVLTMFNYLTAYAGDIPPKNPTGPGDNPPVVHPGGRTAEHLSNVSANLSGDELTIVFGQSEGRVWVEVSDASMMPVYTGHHDSYAPIVIPVQDVEAPLLIYISTEYGAEYEGWIQ